MRIVVSVVALFVMVVGAVGIERAQTILGWEASHTALLRAGTLVALVTGGFVAFAVTKPYQQTRRSTAHATPPQSTGA